MMPATTTMAMINHNHHRLLPLSPPVGTTALLEVTALDETAGAVTSKVATPTVPEFWPIASSRWVPAGKSAGTMNSALATPVWSAVTGDSVIGSENSVRLTCSPARNPEKTTSWVPPATTDGEPICCGMAVPGAVGDVGVDEDDGGAASKVIATGLISTLSASLSLTANSEHLPVTQFGSPWVTVGSTNFTSNDPPQLPSTWAQAADGGVAPCTGPPTHESSAVSEFSVPAQTAMYIPYLSLSAKPSPLTSISAPVTGSPEVGFTVRVAT